MNVKTIISKLNDFKAVDKYRAFHKIQPGIIHTNDDQKLKLEKILNDCTVALIKLLETGKKPTKAALKQIISDCMYRIAHAELDTPNRDFGYELCWFLSEKAGLNMKRSSDNKLWGFWKVEADEVKTISGTRKKRSSEK